MSKTNYLTAPYISWGAVLLLILILQFYHTDVFELLRYERQDIVAGEYWRLITAHFVHLSWGHCLLNIAGYVLILALFGEYLTTGLFLLTILLSMLAIDIGLFTLHKDIHWYVGFSGVLHGLFLAGLIFAYKIDRHSWAKWLLAILTLKLVWEMFMGALPGSTQMSGGKVIVEAHFYGALGGLISSLIVFRIRRGIREGKLS